MEAPCLAAISSVAAAIVCNHLHMRLLRRLWVWTCPTCSTRVEVDDQAHLPLVAVLHELGRCWEPLRD